MDCAVIPLARHKSLSLVQTVDFFYPLVDDPYTMGKIALANVLSDIYAVGVTNIDKLSLILSSPTEFTEKQRDIVLPMIVKGFQESAQLAGCTASVRNIAINPWCIIGGIASSICKDEEIIMPSNAQPGDVLVLTKPLGTQLITNAYRWWEEKGDKYQKLAQNFTESDITESFSKAIQSMMHLNINGALLMHKYGAHAATDVTGFGLLGHADNLAKFQKLKLEFIIEKLPVFKNAIQIGEMMGQDTKLKTGKAVETSGGLLICFPADNAHAFIDEYAQMHDDNQKAWIVGRVTESDEKNAKVVSNVDFIEVL